MPAHPPVTLPRTHSRDLTAPDSDQPPYRLFIALPPDYDTSTRAYPVLYLLDANQWFGTTVENLRLHAQFKSLPDMIVVGIGYPSEDFWAGYVRRAYDLTPTVDADDVAFIREQHGITAPVTSGGGPVLLEFLRSTVIPLVESDYRVDPAARYLAGHSLSGLFALYALLEQPELFAGCLASSPSLWWNQNWFFTHEEQYAAAHKTLPARLFLSIGLDEEVAPWHMVSNLHRLAGILRQRQYENLEFTIASFPDETHFSVIPAAFMRGMRWLLRDPSLRA